MVESFHEDGLEKGWSVRLHLEYEVRHHKTVLTTNCHSGPLVVQRPLYPEDDVCHTYILHPPGGVVGGDSLDLNVLAADGTRTLFTAPGATKFYRSAGAKAVQRQHISVASGAVLEWFPQETIFFPGADVETTTLVNLASEARFMGWEINCLGLPVNDDIFTSGRLQTSFQVHREGVPLFIDRQLVLGREDLFRAAGLRGFPVFATFVATNVASQLVDKIRSIEFLEHKALSGVTLLDDLLIIRYLGFSTHSAQDLFIRIWHVLRPEITGRRCSVPRIWAT